MISNVKGPSETVVHQFDAGRRGTVRTRLRRYRGVRYMDIRLWLEPYGQPGAELIPTPKGLCLEVAYLDDLRAALDVLAAALAHDDNGSKAA